MGDWTEGLGDRERREWEEFVDHVRHDAMAKISESGMFISIAPGGEPDVKFAVELGLAIMFDKPIMVVAGEGCRVPVRLRRVADLVVEADLDLAEGQQMIQRGIQEMAKRFS